VWLAVRDKSPSNFRFWYRDVSSAGAAQPFTKRCTRGINRAPPLAREIPIGKRPSKRPSGSRASFIDKKRKKERKKGRKKVRDNSRLTIAADASFPFRSGSNNSSSYFRAFPSLLSSPSSASAFPHLAKRRVSRRVLRRGSAAKWRKEAGVLFATVKANSYATFYFAVMVLSPLVPVRISSCYRRSFKLDSAALPRDLARSRAWTARRAFLKSRSFRFFSSRSNAREWSRTNRFATIEEKRDGGESRKWIHNTRRCLLIDAHLHVWWYVAFVVDHPLYESRSGEPLGRTRTHLLPRDARNELNGWYITGVPFINIVTDRRTERARGL